MPLPKKLQNTEASTVEKTTIRAAAGTRLSFWQSNEREDEFNAQFRGRFAKHRRREIQLIKNENNPETNSQMALDN